MAGRKGKVAIRDVPTRSSLQPMLEAFRETELKTGSIVTGKTKPNKVIGYINEETKPVSKLEKYAVSINTKQQDHDFRSWLGQESIKDREIKVKKERKVRAVKEATWLDF